VVVECSCLDAVVSVMNATTSRVCRKSSSSSNSSRRCGGDDTNATTCKGHNGRDYYRHDEIHHEE